MSTWFPKLYDGFMAPLEAAGIARRRAQLLRKAQGNCLEVGVGTGANFRFYPMHQIEKLTVLDVSSEMIEKAQHRPHPSNVNFIQGSAQALPFPNAHFDTVLATLVFCSVPEPLQALEEVKRVLKPDGTFLFMEHILSDKPLLAHWQHQLNEPWRHWCDGCNLNRDTPQLIQDAGFQIIKLNAFWQKLFVFGQAIPRK